MKSSFFAGNRAAMMAGVEDGALVLLFAGNSLRKTADESYPFFGNRNFLYLTGIEQEQTALLLQKCGEGFTERLYSLPPDNFKEIWNGRRLREDELKAISGVDSVADVALLERELHSKLINADSPVVYLCLDRQTPDDTTDLEHRFALELRKRYPAVIIKNIWSALGALRRIKQPCEVEAIRTAMQMTELGIKRMMKACKPGMMEYQLEGEFLHELATHGQRSPAFPSIVAAGTRNFYLHYPLPMSRIEDGELVLTDVGAGYEGYCTDVSRMFPANGRFTQRQAAVYSVALAANRAIMAAVKPGEQFTITDELCRKVSFDGLKELGLITDIADIGKYVWHKTTHHVGLNTHDVGGTGMPMAENMVFTVDAGLYIREWGIGLRVEDTVLVTADGCENLSAAIPSEIAAIEAFMAE